MACLVPTAVLPRSGERILRGGMFGIPKKVKPGSDPEDRLISSVTATNKVSPDIDCFSLIPQGAELQHLIVPATSEVESSGDDLKGFYHSLLAPPGRWGFHSVGPPLSATTCRNHQLPVLSFSDYMSILRTDGRSPHLMQVLQARWDAMVPAARRNSSFSLVYKSAPMGSSGAVSVAQIYHTNLLRANGVFDNSLHMVHGCAWLMRDPCGRISPKLVSEISGVVIDDTRHLSVVPRRSGARNMRTAVVAGRDRCRLSAIAYSQVGLERAPHKAVRAERNRDDFWGITLFGRRAVLAPLLSRLVKVLGRVLNALLAGSVSRRTLSQIVGDLTACLLVCRPLFSIFSLVYEEIKTHLDPDDLISLTSGVGGELLCVVMLAPALFQDLRRPLSSTIGFSDASGADGGFGFGAVEVPCNEAWRTAFYGAFCARKGFQTRCYERPGSEDISGLDDIPDSPGDGDSIPALIGKYFHGSVVLQGIFARALRGNHISVLELRILVDLCVHLLEKYGGHVRLLVAVDSQAVVGCVRKGRSGARCLNSLLRVLMGILILYDASLVLGWIGSLWNIADDPSRGVPLRPPIFTFSGGLSSASSLCKPM